jgi:demethylmenaquinone methyltransferase/2-methoxy-6-polyprenyl-1,4-benzoquinol methylase
MKTRYKIHRFFYHLIAKGYDLGMSIYLKKGETNPRDAVAKLVSDNDKTLLEVCAGTCENSIAVAKYNRDIKITATDRSGKMLNVARYKILADNISNIDLKVMDAANLELEDKSFDVAVISLALHELEETTQQAILAEIHRVLKENGKFIVVEWDKPKTISKKIKFSFIELIEPKSYKRLMQQNMDKYFGNAGFKIDDTVLCDYTKVYKLRKYLKNENGR